MEVTDKYRLPLEAEWEYAACAGTTTRYSFGNDKSDLGEYAWYWDNSDRKVNPVGQKQPNPWGLYDMHGNKCKHKAENDLRTAEIVLSTENPPTDAICFHSQQCAEKHLTSFLTSEYF